MPAIIINPRHPLIDGTKTGQSPISSAAGARDVPAGESWAFRDHRTMKQVIADERAARRQAASACKPV
jgi:hypothetical protein